MGGHALFYDFISFSFSFSFSALETVLKPN
jgi:hypothetical protein